MTDAAPRAGSLTDREQTLPEASEDVFLDGAFRVLQPKKGYHRSGSDAVFLGAAVPQTAGLIADLGAGVGVAGLVALSRWPESRLLMVERDPVMADFARKTLDLNPAFLPRARLIACDIAAPPAEREAAGLTREVADHVIANPPYHFADAVRASPHDRRAEAHLIRRDALEDWARTAAASLKNGGLFTLIFRADGLRDLLAVLDGRFGAARILGLHPQAEKPAARVIVQAKKGRRTPPLLLPGLVLHEKDGAYTPLAEAILRGAAALPLGAED